MSGDAKLFRMVFRGPQSEHELQSVAEEPELAEGELWVEMRVATICGSDLHTLEGRRKAPTPCVLGHEGVGKVKAVGEGVEASWVGKRVTWTLADSCGRCEACGEWGLPQKCEHLFKYGHAALDNGSGWNGCFGTHILLRKGTTVVEVPDGLSDRLAAPANCALATMVSVVESISLEHRRILIQGGGLLGLYGSALLRGMGKEVWISDPDESRRAMARRFGAEPFDAAQAGKMDAVIEVAGTPLVVEQALSVLRPGGFYALVGMVHPESDLHLTGERLIRGCFTLRGFHNYAPRHLKDGVEWLDRNQDQFPFEELISPALGLKDLDRAFGLARSKRWHRIALGSVGN